MDTISLKTIGAWVVTTAVLLMSAHSFGLITIPILSLSQGSADACYNNANQCEQQCGINNCHPRHADQPNGRWCANDGVVCGNTSGTDNDSDGYVSAAEPNGNDCDDSNPQIHPDRGDVCIDGQNFDYNCDGVADPVCQGGGTSTPTPTGTPIQPTETPTSTPGEPTPTGSPTQSLLQQCAIQLLTSYKVFECLGKGEVSGSDPICAAAPTTVQYVNIGDCLRLYTGSGLHEGDVRPPVSPSRTPQASTSGKPGDTSD